MQTRKEFNPGQAMVGSPESFTELIVELAEKSAVLVREEVSLARQELREDIRGVKSSVLMLGLGVGAAVLALMSLVAAVILALSQYWEPWQAALLVGLGLGLIAAIILGVAVSHLKQAKFKPEQTLVTLKENKEWLKELT